MKAGRERRKDPRMVVKLQREIMKNILYVDFAFDFAITYGAGSIDTGKESAGKFNVKFVEKSFANNSPSSSIKVATRLIN